MWWIISGDIKHDVLANEATPDVDTTLGRAGSPWRGCYPSNVCKVPVCLNPTRFSELVQAGRQAHEERSQASLNVPGTFVHGSPRPRCDAGAKANAIVARGHLRLGLPEPAYRAFLRE